MKLIFKIIIIGIAAVVVTWGAFWAWTLARHGTGN
jgi:hypothetical protein